MAFGTSTWLAVNGDWTATADWNDGEPPNSTNTNLAALFNGSAQYTVTVDSNIGSIATSGSVANTVGVTLNDALALLDITSGGTLGVGAANGSGGLVQLNSGEIKIDAGGSFSETNTLTIGGSGLLLTNGGVASVGRVALAGGLIVIGTGTVALLGALSETSNGRVELLGNGELDLNGISGLATISLDGFGLGNTGAHLYWTAVDVSGLANVTLTSLEAGTTLDVATTSAMTISGVAVVSNTLTISSSGGTGTIAIVGLGAGAASQYYATATTLAGQNIVRITSALTTSNWIDGTTGNWTTAADWDDSVPPSGSASNYAAVLGGSANYAVTLNTNVGTIAAAASSASTVGLALNNANSALEIASGGALAVGASNGNGGLVNVSGGLVEVDAGGRLSATNTLTVGSSGQLFMSGGVASLASLVISGSLFITAGTVTISGTLTSPGMGVFFEGAGVLNLNDLTGSASIDLDAFGTAPHARVFWTNTAIADLANLTLISLEAGTTLDVATSTAVTITGTTQTANALTIDVAGGANIVVGLGAGAASQYYATATTLGSQNIVRVTAALTTSTYIGAGGDWTTAASWDDAVPPGSSASNYAAALTGSSVYIVTLASNIGTIAAAASNAATVGLSLNGAGRLFIQSGGALTVGALNGNGGRVTISHGEILATQGASFATTSTLSVASSMGNLALLQDQGGVVSVAALNLAAGNVDVSNGGTLAIAGALTQTGGTLTFDGPGLLTLGDFTGTSNVNLDRASSGATDARVYWTNTNVADLANLTLTSLEAGTTLDVATTSAMSISSVAVVSNKLTISSSGGTGTIAIVGLGAGAASQYYAAATTLGSQNIVRITAALTTSNWIDGTTGNWTTAADWDDSVPPSASASNYAAVLGGSADYSVTVNSTIGAIATTAVTTSTVGLTLNNGNMSLVIAQGGVLAVGAANGSGGLVNVASGLLAVNAGGSFSATNTLTVGSSGVLNVLGGVASVATLASNGGVINILGGTLVIAGALRDGSDSIAFQGANARGVLELNDIANSVAVNVDLSHTSTDARVYWTNAATTADLANLSLTNLDAGTTLDVATNTAVTITGTTQTTSALTIDVAGGANIVVGLGAGAAPSFLVTDAMIGNQNIVHIVAACYLRGTGIATPSGNVPIEDLRVGQRVLTPGGTQPVKWIGTRTLVCARHPRPEDVWPVRIDPDAFGPGIPSRTLRLSPDHAVFFDGVLIPVRYLVNGATIVQERAETVSYWHVELSRHNVVFAEGLTCESYLDTGNRSVFENGGDALMLHSDFALRVWDAEGFAPLVREGAELEAVRSWLLERAGALGCRLTADPGLELIAGSVRLTPQIRMNGRIWRVALPPGADTLRLVSRLFVAAHVRPESDDCRTLGVAVARLWLDGAEISLDDPRLVAGWQPPEEKWRWTDGAATLAVGGARMLQLELAPAGRYWAERETRAATRAA